MNKIFCTLGPASLNSDFLGKIKKFNVSLLRINLSHTNIKDLKKIILFIKKRTSIPICIDTEGAQIRTIYHTKRLFKKNTLIKIDNNSKSKNLSLYPDIYNKLSVNMILDVGFENLKINIIRKEKKYFIGKIVSEGFLEKNKGVHIQNKPISLPTLTNKDIQAIKIAKEMKITNFALSFTNSSKDIFFFNKMIPKERKIIKIETRKAINNINDILKNCDEILIDRGDLSKEINFLEVPNAQRQIQKIANTKNKKVYIATNLLESMVSNPYPTRAEINDIYNCLELGAEGIVLAAETAIGKWPLECVKITSDVIKKYNKVVKKK
tara:strand:+ start:1334 stop:2302 length:969 start_codon:yes stop_codon:yes gene_type:complete